MDSFPYGVIEEVIFGFELARSRRGFKQADAAKMLGVTQPRISDLLQGKIDLFSIDNLVDMLAHAGVRVKLVIGTSKRKLKVA
jgi:predicted XRE-type DNA-binding protein